MLAWMQVFSLVAAVLMVVANHFFHGYHPAKGAPLPVDFMLVGEALSAATMFVATWAMGRLTRCSMTSYGFAWRGQGWNFVLGSASSLTLLSGLIAILHAFGWLQFEGTHPGFSSAAWNGLRWAVAFLFLGIFEEGFVRGYLQYALGRSIGFWWSALFLSFAFALTHKHNAGESPIGLLSAGLIGMVFCLSLYRSGSLAWAVGFHSVWDWAEAFLFGVPNSGTISQGRFISTHAAGSTLWSGGATGPEGSLLILPAIAVAALCAWRLTIPSRTSKPDVLPVSASMDSPHR